MLNIVLMIWLVCVILFIHYFTIVIALYRIFSNLIRTRFTVAEG
jgi:hypothetical protein